MTTAKLTDAEREELWQCDWEDELAAYERILTERLAALREEIAQQIEFLQPPAAPEFARGFGLARGIAATVARRLS